MYFSVLCVSHGFVYKFLGFANTHAPNICEQLYPKGLETSLRREQDKRTHLLLLWISSPGPHRKFEYLMMGVGEPSLFDQGQ